MLKTSVDRTQGLKDLMEAMEPTSEENMTGLELAKVLGVPLGANGEPDLVDFFNACIGVQTNEAVQQLPHDQKIRVIRTAAAALDHMRG